jgi:DNA-binding NarL/FixJ family response regulator
LPDRNRNARKHTVLLVDDNPIVRELVRRTIEKRARFTICGEAADGMEAVEQAKALRPEVVVLDFSMPGMSGIEAAPLIRDALPDACVILFTLYGNDALKSAAKEAGIDAVVSKADLGDELMKTTKRVFGEKRTLIS